MVFPLGGLIGGMIGIRGLHAGATAARVGIHAAPASFAGTFLKSPLIQGGGFGVGYTGGSYGGYGISNTWDPLGIHRPKYKPVKSKLGMPYGYGSYGRRRYRRYSGYTRYGRSSYYRRRRPYYRRRSYY